MTFKPDSPTVNDPLMTQFEGLNYLFVWNAMITSMFSRDTASPTLGQFRLVLFGVVQIFKEKILFPIVSLLLFVAASAAADFTYQEYTKAPELWKRGVVFGIARYMSAVAQPDEEPRYPVRTAFQRCLASSTDSVLVREVEAYAATNPASSKGPMVAIIMRAFFNLCRAEIEKAQSPKTAPSQR